MGKSLRLIRICFIAISAVACATLRAASPVPYTDIFRVPIPDKLPEHPRVFCTQADLDRIQADLKRGDFYTKQTVETVRRHAESICRGNPACTGTKVHLSAAKNAAALAQAWALTGEEKYGQLARKHLLWFAEVYPKLPTTRSHGRFADSTLREGPYAVECAMAYDLIANAPFLTASDRQTIERDLLRTMAWECGHTCTHRDSSNWRTWALAIVSSCGFAIGDRQLIEEAVNGVWDPKRKSYLYGAVQQINHSFFSDGIHWERSAGYTYYTLSALKYVLIPAYNAGIDLWHAEIPSLMGPFQGSAAHEEYGPAGNRSVRYALDALFYLPFQNGRYAVINDTGRSRLHLVPIFLSAYAQYQDPKYAWLIRQNRDYDDKPSGWQVWKPKGEVFAASERKTVRSGAGAYRLKTDKQGRVALVQNVSVDTGRPSVVTGWVKPLQMAGGSAHIRVNPAGQGDFDAVFTNHVKKAGDWVQVRAEIPAGPKSLRLHVFLEGGEGEVIWDSIEVNQSKGVNLVLNPGFDLSSADGRQFGFWDLVHAPAEVPEGHYTLAEDAKIGLTGRHENGCTLFPVGGFAVMRSDPADVNATAFTLTFGPYGSGHDHPDRLHFSLYGLNDILMPDAGSWGYDNPMHLTWANQTIAHNTLTVDEEAQRPQGMSDSIWAGEGSSMRVFGELRLFYPGKALKAVRATCDTAYPGVRMDRTLCLVGNYVVDVLRATSNEVHTYDLAYHGLGELKTGGAFPGESGASFTRRGYSHLEKVRRAPFASGVAAFDYNGPENRLVRLITASPGEDAELVMAAAPYKGSGSQSVVFLRRRARSALFVSLLEPHRGSPVATRIRSRQNGDTLEIEVTRVDGVDVLWLDGSLTGQVRLERRDSKGKLTASDVARP